MIYKIITLFIINQMTIGFPHDYLDVDQNHIVSCANSVLHRYFIPGSRIHIHLPIQNRNDDDGDERDENFGPNFNTGEISFEEMNVLDSYLKIIYKAIQWSFLISGQCFSLDDAPRDIEKDEGYLIFTPSQITSESGWAKFKDQMLDISETSTWNSGAAFLFIVTHTAEESPEIIARNILSTYWIRKNVFNSIITVLHWRSKLEKPEIITYSWILKHSKQKCMEFNELITVDTCIAGINFNGGKQWKLTNNKIPSNFEGCPLSVKTPLKNWKLKVLENGETEVVYEEPEMNFIQLVFNKLNLTLKHGDPLIDVEDYPERVTKCVGLLVIGNCDVALGYMPLGDDMILYTDSAIPYTFVNFNWYVPCGRMVSRLETFSRIFTYSVWLLFVCSLLGAILVIRMKSKLCSLWKCNEPPAFMSISGCALSLWAVVLGMSASGMPRTSSVRTFFMLFIWYSFAINIIFQAFFTSYLVNPGTKSRIQSFQEMIDSGIEIGYDPFIDYHFQGSPDPRFIEARKRRVDCRDRPYCFGRVDITGDMAYMDADYYAEWYAAVNKNPHMCRLDDGDLVMMISSHFRKDSVFVDVFNRVLYRLVESGIASKIVDDHNYEVKAGRIEDVWTKKLTNETLVDPDERLSTIDEYVQYSLSHLQATFYFVLVGYTVSSVVLLLEWVCYKMF